MRQGESGTCQSKQVVSDRLHGTNLPGWRSDSCGTLAQSKAITSANKLPQQCKKPLLVDRQSDDMIKVKHRNLEKAETVAG